MNFSFAIPTDFSDVLRVDQIIQSIRSLKIPNYEILIISKYKRQPLYDTEFLFFDQNDADNKINLKKTILIDHCKHDNIVLFHDYFIFDQDWYTNYLSFGEDWDVCSNPQLLITGKRHFTDWVVWDSPIYPRWASLDYDDWTHTKYMYQSGGYMLVKKQFIRSCPLNPSMVWGSAEDVEWSLRMRNIARWKCNSKSIVRHNKIHRDAL